MDAPYTAFAAVYDALMHDVPYDRWAQRLDALLRAALAAPAGAAVADAACGTGALTVRLAQRGYRMTGADLSADMLLVAQERRAGAGFPSRLCRWTCARCASTGRWTRSCAHATASIT